MAEQRNVDLGKDLISALFYSSASGDPHYCTAHLNNVMNVPITS